MGGDGPIGPTGAPPQRDLFAALPTPDLIERYAQGITLIDRRVLEMPDDALDTYFRAEAGVGRWSCRVVVGHLADAEIAFAHRFRRAASEEGPLLHGWDQDAFIDANLYTKETPIAGFVAVIHTLRKFSTEWLGTLDEAAWGRRALSQSMGERTLGGLLVDATWHLEHHAWYLNAKIARLVGPDGGGGS